MRWCSTPRARPATSQPVPARGRNRAAVALGRLPRSKRRAPGRRPCPTSREARRFELQILHRAEPHRRDRASCCAPSSPPRRSAEHPLADDRDRAQLRPRRRQEAGRPRGRGGAGRRTEQPGHRRHGLGHGRPTAAGGRRHRRARCEAAQKARRPTPRPRPCGAGARTDGSRTSRRPKPIVKRYLARRRAAAARRCASAYARVLVEQRRYAEATRELAALTARPARAARTLAAARQPAGAGAPGRGRRDARSSATSRWPHPQAEPKNARAA